MLCHLSSVLGPNFAQLGNEFRKLMIAGPGDGERRFLEETGEDQAEDADEE